MIDVVDPSRLAVESDGDWWMLGGTCSACGTNVFPYRPGCPACSELSVEQVKLPKTGVLVAATTVHRTLPNSCMEAPYTVAKLAFEAPYDDIDLLVSAADPSLGAVVAGTHINFILVAICEDNPDIDVTYSYSFEPSLQSGRAHG